MAEKDYEKIMREKFGKYGKVITPVDICNALAHAGAKVFANHPSEVRELVKNVIGIVGAETISILFPEIEEGGNDGDTV